MLMYISVVLILILVLAYLLWRFIRSRKYQFVGKIVNRVKTDEKVVALTFDDGPMPGFSERILGILNECGIKATFFFVGSAIKENPELARKFIADGHQIGNHTFSHKKMVFVSTKFVEEELETTTELMKEAGYDGEIIFRPPYGKKFINLPLFLKKKSITNVMWDVEPEKYADATNPESIAEYAAKNVKPGSIILLHAMFASREKTIEAIPLVINKLLDKGYQFLSVSELLKKQA